MIHFENVYFSYGTQIILRGVSFDVKPGEFVFIIGRSGAGKSTLLQLLYANQFPDSGNIYILDYDINNMKQSEIPMLRRKLGIVFQDFKMLPDRNVYENLAFVLRVIGTGSRTIKKKVIHSLTDIGLADKQKFNLSKLSGGEKQRLAIARAVINDPPIILADEPTGNLDPETTDEIFDILLRINKRGTTLLCATHNYNIVKKYRARTLRLSGGEIRELSEDEIDRLD